MSLYYQIEVSDCLLGQIHSILSQQIHCSVKRSQDETAMILRTLEADISKSNAHLPLLVHRMETISNELTSGMHNSFEQQQQIITALAQTTTDVSRLTQEWETIAPTVRCTFVVVLVVNYFMYPVMLTYMTYVQSCTTLRLF